MGVDGEFSDAHAFDVSASIVGTLGLAIGGAAFLAVALLALPFTCSETAWFFGPPGRSWLWTASQRCSWARGSLPRFSATVGLRS